MISLGNYKERLQNSLKQLITPADRGLPFLSLFRKNPTLLTQIAEQTAFIGFLAVLLFESVVGWQRFSKPSAEMEIPLALPKVSQLKPVSMDEIINSHLFGEAVPVSPKESKTLTSEQLQNAPETTLSLVLKGVYTAEDPNNASAIISSPEGGDKFYKVGAVIPGPAVLRQVYAKKVVIEVEGRLESLWLYEPVEINQADPLLKSKVSETNQSLKKIDKRENKKLSKMLSEYRMLLETDPMQLLTLMRIAPAELDGKRAGFRVIPGAEKESFEALGLNEGDIVTRVNGMPLDSLDAGASVLEAIKKADEITLEVNRKGESIEVIYNLR